LENKINKLVNQINTDNITDNRKYLLRPLCDYVRLNLKEKVSVNLNFICTHNSRRSQLSQLWAKVISNFYEQDINTFSGGIEITACNERIITSLKKIGFSITNSGGENPHYQVKYDQKRPPIVLFSKIYDDTTNPIKNFAAVITCNKADENCPLIPGADKRISIPYDDPKAFDDTVDEAKMYYKRSIQIATEMKYVFTTILS
tara:strand:+ start:1848 stop:2453 length:606 start_codon:yes stop_codon:yes gene_type:complete